MESSHKIPKTGKSQLNVSKGTVPTDKQNLCNRWKVRGNHLRAKMLSNEASMCRRKCIRASVVCIVLSILGAFLSLAALRYKGFIYEISKPYLHKAWIEDRDGEISAEACNGFLYMKAACVLYYFYSMLSLFSGVMLLFAVIKNDVNQKKILASLIVTGIAFGIILYAQVWVQFVMPLADLQGFVANSFLMVLTLCPFQVLFKLGLELYKIMEKLKAAQDAIGGTEPNYDELAKDILANEMKSPAKRIKGKKAGVDNLNGAKNTKKPLTSEAKVGSKKIRGFTKKMQICTKKSDLKNIETLKIDESRDAQIDTASKIKTGTESDA